MIFDSKRRHAQEAEEDEAVTLAKAPYEASAVPPDELRTPPPAVVNRLAERGAYPEDRQDIERRADAAVDQSATRGTPEPDRTVAHTHIGTDAGAGTKKGDLDDLDPVLPLEVAEDFRRGWDAVQIAFVDDPQQAVRDADQLVNGVLRRLGETFTLEHTRVETQAAHADSDSTENLRVAMRRYRSFLNRLLSV
ncbi:hypothetical protein WKW80_11735 [Variovorax humicola]|uniref:Uncharacterized protein n=1 Tax=Variovorax humicola TaxID=1769758 RepID=A0ABU8W005_9BURK